MKRVGGYSNGGKRYYFIGNSFNVQHFDERVNFGKRELSLSSDEKNLFSHPNLALTDNLCSDYIKN